MTKPNTKLADRFDAAAEKMQNQIDDKFQDRNENTAKRARQAQQARNEGQHLARTQQAMRRLAEQHRAGTVADCHQMLSAKSHVHAMTGARMDLVGGIYVDSGEPAKAASHAALLLWELLEPKTAEQIETERIDGLVRDLQFSKIPGYFPTPGTVVDLMLHHANVAAGMSVLEPSAGHGSILDLLPADVGPVTCFEFNWTLSEILETKGYEPQGDFLNSDPELRFDRIVMNPPFERQQDVTHVTRAIAHLAPGGRLVAVVSNGATFRTDNKGTRFRELLDGYGATWVALPDGTFAESGTNVHSCLVIVDAPR